LSKEDPTVCGAKTPGGPCQAVPEEGRTRCRLHGGAKGSGAPKGNQNALKHGLTTKEQLAQVKRSNAFWRAMARLRSARRRKKDVATAYGDLIAIVECDR